VVRGKTYVSKNFIFQAKQQSMNQKLNAGEQYTRSDVKMDILDVKMDMDRIKVSKVQARANPKKSLYSRYHLQKLDPASKLSMQIWIVTPITIDTSS
jgi:ligand-binding sensor domain-containing protein